MNSAQTKVISQNQSKTLHQNDILTCLYLPPIIYFLHYNNFIFQIGKFENIYVLILFASLEILKFFLYNYRMKVTNQKLQLLQIIQGLLLFVLLIPIFYIIAILFGAPIFESFEETLMFALILAILVGLSPILHLGPKNTIAMLLSITMYKGDSINWSFVMKMRLTLAGAWLGAVPIPLDWNRPWQEWPITCCAGGLLGFLAGHFITIIIHTKGSGKNTGRKIEKAV